MKALFCKHCNISFDSIGNIDNANHVRWCLKNPNRKQKKVKICAICKSEFTRRGKSCSDECRKLIVKHTDEYKQKQSISQKQYLKDNPDKHPWKNNNKFKSHPCEKLKDYLNDNNIVFIEEWKPLDDRFFSIDIAFPDIKLGIEVNGNQHYNSDGTLKEYYQERHDLIEQRGWKLIEIHYSSCYNIDKIKNIFEIREQPDYTEYFKIKQERDHKTQNKPKALLKGVKLRNNTDIKWEPFKELVLQSNIVFSKFGWVEKTSIILGISSQKVSTWMKRYLPEFYETRCFKRKRPAISHLASNQTLIE